MSTVDRLTKVVAAVVSRDGRYLVARRPQNKHHGGLWEFPGGKLHKGETATHAIKRELREELGVNVVSIGKTVAVLSDELIQIRFLAVDFKDEPMALEHSELQWCNLPELTRVDLAPIDKRFVSNIFQLSNRERKR